MRRWHHGARSLRLPCLPCCHPMPLPTLFASSSCLAGLLHVWDVRQPERPTMQLQQPAPPSAAASVAALPVAGITALDVHPAQHYCVATGAADGTVAVWDLRSASSSQQQQQQAQQPPPQQQAAVACCTVGGAGAGAVCDLRFEGASTIGSGSQRLVYCTSGGAIGLLRDAASGAGRLLFQEPTAAVRACCLGAVAAPAAQLFCATDQEGLVFMANCL